MSYDPAEAIAALVLDSPEMDDAAWQLIDALSEGEGDPAPAPYARQGRPLQYDWEQGPAARTTTASGKQEFIWKSTTGEHERVQAEKPGSGRGEGKPDESGGGGGGQAQPEAAPQEPHEQWAGQVKGWSNGKLDDNQVQAFVGQITAKGVTAKQLHGLRKSLGLTGSGLKKSDVAARIENHVKGMQVRPGKEPKEGMTPMLHLVKQLLDKHQTGDKEAMGALAGVIKHMDAKDTRAMRDLFEVDTPKGMRKKGEIQNAVQEHILKPQEAAPIGASPQSEAVSQPETPETAPEVAPNIQSAPEPAEQTMQSFPAEEKAPAGEQPAAPEPAAPEAAQEPAPAEPESPQEKPLHELAEKHLSRFKAALDKSPRLSPEQREAYHATAKGILERMTPKMLERFGAGTPYSPQFAASSDDLKEHLKALFKNSPKALAALAGTGPLGGGYFRDNKGNGGLALDGGRPSTRPAEGAFPQDGSAEGVYAHEFSHAIDGPNHELSNSDEWKAAYGAMKGKMNRYADTGPQEGFAEFGRLLLSGKVPHGDVADHPDLGPAFAFWKSQGLVDDPQQRGTGQEVKQGDLFSRRIELPAHNHADEVAPTPAATVPSPAGAAQGGAAAAPATAPTPTAETAPTPPAPAAPEVAAPTPTPTVAPEAKPEEQPAPTPQPPAPAPAQQKPAAAPAEQPEPFGPGPGAPPAGSPPVPRAMKNLGPRRWVKPPTPPPPVDPPVPRAAPRLQGQQQGRGGPGPRATQGGAKAAKAPPAPAPTPPAKPAAPTTPATKGGAEKPATAKPVVQPTKGPEKPTATAEPAATPTVKPAVSARQATKLAETLKRDAGTNDWARSGADRLAEMAGMLSGKRVSDPDAVVGSLSTHGLEKHLGSQVGAAVDSLGRQLLDRLDKNGKDKVAQMFPEGEKRDNAPPAVRDFLAKQPAPTPQVEAGAPQTPATSAPQVAPEPAATTPPVAAEAAPSTALPQPVANRPAQGVGKAAPGPASEPPPEGPAREPRTDREWLGVPENATQKQIDVAWAKASRELHPDRTSDDPVKTARFKAIKDAYERITKERKEDELFDPSAGTYTGNREARAVVVGEPATDPKQVRHDLLKSVSKRLGWFANNGPTQTGMKDADVRQKIDEMKLENLSRAELVQAGWSLGINEPNGTKSAKIIEKIKDSAALLYHSSRVKPEKKPRTPRAATPAATAAPTAGRPAATPVKGTGKSAAPKPPTKHDLTAQNNLAMAEGKVANPDGTQGPWTAEELDKQIAALDKGIASKRTSQVARTAMQSELGGMKKLRENFGTTTTPVAPEPAATPAENYSPPVLDGTPRDGMAPVNGQEGATSEPTPPATPKKGKTPHEQAVDDAVQKAMAQGPAPTPYAPPSDPRVGPAILEALKNEHNVSIPQLRRKMPKEWQGKEFDKAILWLADQRKLIVSQDAMRPAFSDAQHAEFVQDGDNFFTTVSPASVNASATPPAAKATPPATPKAGAPSPADASMAKTRAAAEKSVRDAGGKVPGTKKTPKANPPVEESPAPGAEPTAGQAVGPAVTGADADLREKAGQGDQAAQDELLKKTLPLLKRRIEAKLRGNPELQEEMFAEASHKLLASLRKTGQKGGYDPAFPLENYVSRLAHNVIGHYFRDPRNKGKVSIGPTEEGEPGLDPAGSGASPDEEVSAGERTKGVSDAVKKLPERDQAVVKWFMDGLTFDEIGTKLGVSKARAHQIYKVALKALRTDLGDKDHYQRGTTDVADDEYQLTDEDRALVKRLLAEQAGVPIEDSLRTYMVQARERGDSEAVKMYAREIADLWVEEHIERVAAEARRKRHATGDAAT